MTRFIFGATTVQFNCDPIRPARSLRDLRQLREVDSAGASVVYGKGDGVITYTLTFPRVTDAVLSSLRAFVELTVAGVRRSFIWVDHAEVSRTARLTSPRLQHTALGPNQHRVEIGLEVAA